MGLHKEKQTIYIVKYALSKGIQKKEAKISDLNELGMGKHIYAMVDEEHHIYKIGIDAFFTLSETISKANDMRRRKIESYRRKIAKLNEIDFNI